jgi:hypothetical protein
VRSGFSRNGNCEVGEGEEGAHEDTKARRGGGEGGEKRGAHEDTKTRRGGGEGRGGGVVFSERSEDESLLQGMLG